MGINGVQKGWFATSKSKLTYCNDWRARPDSNGQLLSKSLEHNCLLFLPIRLSPVSDAHYLNCVGFFINLINDSIITHPDSPITSGPYDFMTSCRPWILGKGSDMFDEAAEYGRRKPRLRSRSAALSRYISYTWTMLPQEVIQAPKLQGSLSHGLQRP